MENALTVGELRKTLEGVPDDLEVILTSDSGVDQGLGEIVIETARYIKPSTAEEKGWFEIYANDHCDNMPDCEGLSDEENERIMKLLAECDEILKGD